MNNIKTGGLYQFRLCSTDDFQHYVVLDQNDKYLKVHVVEAYIDTDLTDSAEEIIEFIEFGLTAGLSQKTLRENSFQIIEKSDDEHVIKYLCQVKNELLEKLRKIAKEENCKLEGERNE